MGFLLSYEQTMGPSMHQRSSETFVIAMAYHISHHHLTHLTVMERLSVQYKQ